MRTLHLNSDRPEGRGKVSPVTEIRGNYSYREEASTKTIGAENCQTVQTIVPGLCCANVYRYWVLALIFDAVEHVEPRYNSTPYSSSFHLSHPFGVDHTWTSFKSACSCFSRNVCSPRPWYITPPKCAVENQETGSRPSVFLWSGEAANPQSTPQLP